MTIFYRMSELIKKDIIKYSPLIIPIGTACIINKLIFNISKTLLHCVLNMIGIKKSLTN